MARSRPAKYLLQTVDTVPACASDGADHSVLDGADLGERAELNGRKLRAELKSLVAACPATNRTSAALARWLGVSRPVCHRLLAGIGCDGDGLGVLAEMPGHGAIEQVIRAAEAKGIKRSIVTGALIAAADYGDVIGRAGGSQNKLLGKLIRLREDLALRGVLGGRGLGERRAMHDSAARLMGIACEACFTMYMLLPERFGPEPKAGRLSALHAMAWLGVRATTSHFPLVASRVSDIDLKEGGATTLEYSRADGFTPGAILGSFSSLPFPKVNSEMVGNRLVQHINLAAARGMNARDGKDVVIGNRFAVSPPTRRDGLGVHQISVLPRIATGKLTLDVLVHKDLRAKDLRARGVYFVGHEGLVIDDPDRRWADRLDHLPTLTRPSAGEVPDGIHIKYRELLDAMMSHAGTKPEEFDLFRMSMDYPIQGWQHLAELIVE